MSSSDNNCKKKNGWTRWLVGFSITLFIQLLGVAFVAGVVWQKLTSVSEQVADLRAYIQEQTADNYKRTEAMDRFLGIESRIGRLESVHLEGYN